MDNQRLTSRRPHYMVRYPCNRGVDIRDENQGLFCCGRFHSKSYGPGGSAASTIH